MNERRPAVGTAAVIMRDHKILLGLRQGSHAAGLWALPGGHLEWGEDFRDSLAREIEEETDLLATKIEKLTFTNDVLPDDDKHYVTLYFLCEVEPGEPRLMEPHKCARWGWFSLDNLPFPIWPGLSAALKALDL